MSDENEYEDEGDEGERDPGWYRKQMRETNKRLADAEARAEKYEGAARQVAFQDAKIPDTPQTKFFREHYDGEWTSEAIRASALEHGFADEMNPANDQDIAAMNAMSAAASGGEGAPSPNDLSQMEREMDEAAEKAMPGFESHAIKEVMDRYRKSPV